MRSVTSIAILLALAAGAVMGQQSLIQSQGQVLVFSGVNNTPTGDPVPGSTSGELFGATGGLDNNAVLDDAGNVLFRATIVDSTGTAYPSAQAGFGKGFFYGNSRSGLVKIFRGTDPEPSGTIPNALLTNPLGSVPFGSNPRLAGNGTIMISSTILDSISGNTSSTNNEVLYYGTPGSVLQILARKGDVAPGTGGATFSQAFGSLSWTQDCITSGGYVLFFGALTGTGISGTNNNAWFGGLPGNIVPMMRKGDLGPGGEIVTSLGLNFNQMNANGQLVSDVAYTIGSGTTPVTNLNDKAVWIYTPGGANQTLVREGDATPIPGTFFANGTNWAPTTGTTSFDSSGRLLCSTFLTGAVTANVDDRAVMLLSLSGHTVVFRRGTPAPGVSGATLEVATDASLVLNNNGRIAFESTMAGSVTTANDTGIWTGTPGNLTLVVREGDVAPGTGGLTFGNLNGALTMNAAGQILFQNTLSNTFTSYWSWDPVLGLQCVVRNGDSIEVQPGVFKTVANSFGLGAPNTNGDGRPMGFANDGTTAIRVTFTDTSSALVKVRVGSLTGLAATISQATGGTHSLYLNAGAAHAGEVYVVAGSASGTLPGTPVGAYVVPLNLDWYTDLTLQSANVLPFVNTFGILNGDGRALAQVVIPAGVPGLAGIVVHHAYGVIGVSNDLVFASEASRLEITP